MRHEERDASTFSKWGVYYLKYDICSYRKILEQDAHDDPEVDQKMMFVVFEKMHAALQATGRPIVYSLIQHGLSRGWKRASQTGANLWRAGDDVRDDYLSVAEIGFAQADLFQFAGAGHWNDPDMLEIGNEKLTPDEFVGTHGSAFACCNDLSKMDSDSVDILSNRDVLRIDQDHVVAKGTASMAKGLWKFGLELWQADLSQWVFSIGTW